MQNLKSVLIHKLPTGLQISIATYLLISLFKHTNKK